MGWLEDALRNYARARQQIGQGDAPEGGTQAPPPLAEDPQDQVRLLMQGYQQYLKRSGRKQDPLLDGLRTRRLKGGITQMDDAGPQGELVPAADDEAFRVTSHGPRAGMVHQRYDLGGGNLANVYYDPRTGARKVFRFRSS